MSVRLIDRKTDRPKDRQTCILGTVLIKILYVVLVLSTVALLLAAAAAYVRVRRHLAAKHEGLAGGSLAGGSEEEHQPRQAVRGD